MLSMRALQATMILLIAFGGLGCASSVTYRLKFVDEATGRPLDGVRLETLLHGHHFNNRAFPAEATENAPPSDAAGETTLTLTVGEGLGHYILISRTGYHKITGGSTIRGLWELCYRTEDDPAGVSGEFRVAVSPSMTTTIKMRALERPR